MLKRMVPPLLKRFCNELLLIHESVLIYNLRFTIVIHLNWLMYYIIN
jgi:hypothetical protein